MWTVDEFDDAETVVDRLEQCAIARLAAHLHLVGRLRHVTASRLGAAAIACSEGSVWLLRSQTSYFFFELLPGERCYV